MNPYLVDGELHVEEARQRLADLVMRARRGEAFVVRADGKPAAVLIGFDDWQLLTEGTADVRARAVEAHTRQADTGSGRR